MKFFLVYILVTLALGSANSRKSWVFLIAGQSNSVGYNVDGYTDEDTPDERIQQLSCCFNGTTLPLYECDLILAQHPLHHVCDNEYLIGPNVGFGLSFAKKVLQDIPDGDDVVLVPAGIGGTGFLGNVWPAYTGSGFVSAVNRMMRTFDVLRWQQRNATLEGILWHQGEFDAGDNGQGETASTDQYLNTFMVPMVNAFRNSSYLDFTSGTVPFVFANLLPSWGSNSSHPERSGVWNAIALLDQSLLYSASAPSTGLLGDPVHLSNGQFIHFTAKGQRILGRRYFDAWLLAKDVSPEEMESV